MFLDFLDAIEVAPSRPFCPDSSVVSLDVGVPLWLAWLDVKIVWAHTGLGEPASQVYRLMSGCPGLVADTSLLEYAILGSENTLDPVWERIILEFQDRLMVGSDTWVNSQWDNYSVIIAANRQWLSLLPRPVAEKIAFRNAERLFGRATTNDLIGKK